MVTSIKQVKRVALMTAALMVALAGTLLAGDVQKIIPADATLCVYIRDFTQLETQWKSTFLYKFTKDPQVENFILPLKKKIDAMAQDGQSADQKALLSHFKGEMAFNVSNFAMKPGGEPDASFFIVAEHASDPAALQASLTKFIQSQGKVESQTSADFMGVKIYTLKVSEATAAAIPGSDPSMPMLSKQESLPFHFAVLPKHMVLSSGPDTSIKQVVQMSQQGGPTVFESEGFKNNFTGDYSAFPLVAYANLKNLSALVNQLGGGQGVSLSGLGLESISSLGLAVNLKPDQIETWSVLYAPGAKTGVTKLFFPSEQPNFDQALALVPTDAASFGVTSFSIPDLWAVIKQGVNTINPQWGQMLTMQIQQINMSLQFDIERDLIGSLGSEFVQYSKPGASTQTMPGMGAGMFGGMGMDNTVMMFSLKDQARFQGALDKTLEFAKMMSGGQEMVQKQEFMGFALYTVQTGMEMSAPGTTPTTPSPGFVVTPKHFAFASDVEEVKQVIRATQSKGGKSMLDNAEFKAIYDKAKGPSLKSLGYTSSDAMKQWSAALQSMSMLAIMDPDNELNEIFNFAAVPPASVFQKYFGAQYSTSNMQNNKVIGHYVFNGAK